MAIGEKVLERIMQRLSKYHEEFMGVLRNIRDLLEEIRDAQYEEEDGGD